MIIEFQEKYTGDRLVRPIANLADFRAKTGVIKTLDIWANNPSEIGDTTFQLFVNGVAKFASGDRPVMIATTSHVEKTGLAFSVTKGDRITFDAEIVGVGGYTAPLIFQVTIDDGIPNGSVEDLQDMVGAMFNGQGSGGVTVSYVDASAVITVVGTAPPTTEQIQDLVAAFLVAGTNITLTYDDTANTLTIIAAGGGSGGGIVLSDSDPMVDPDPTPDAGFTQGWFNSSTNQFFVWTGVTDTWATVQMEIPEANPFPTGLPVFAYYEAWRETAYANNDTVPLFVDQNGGVSRDAVSASDPIYKTAQINSLAAFDFNGSHRMTLPDISGLTGIEVWVIAKTTAGTGDNATQLHSIGTDAAADHYDLSDRDIYTDFGRGSRLNFASSGSDVRTWHCGQFISVVGEWRYLFNGTSKSTTAVNTVAINNPASLGSPGGEYKGLIAAYFIFTEKLDSGDRAAMKAYVEAVYGLTLA